MSEGFRVVRGRLTYANVLSTMALFVALGGASYAAVTLPRNSVGAAQLREGAVTPRKLGVALTSNSGEVLTPQTVPGASPLTFSGTFVRTKQQANILVFVSGIVANKATSGRDATVTLTPKIDPGGPTGFAPPPSVSAVAPGAQQSATLVAEYPGLPPGRHLVTVQVSAAGGPVSISSVQVTAIALPPIG